MLTAIWNRLSIRSKLLLSIGAILTIFVVTIAIDYVSTERQSALVEKTMGRTVPMRSEGASLRRSLSIIALGTLRYTLDTSKSDAKKDLARFNAATAEAEQALASLKSLSPPDQQPQIDAFSAWFSGQFMVSKRRAIQLTATDKVAAFRESARVPSSVGDAMMKKLNDDLQEQVTAARAAIHASAKVSQTISVVAGLLSVALGFAIALWLGASISKPLQAVSTSMDEVVHDEVAMLVSSMEQLATGNLTAKVTTHHMPLVVSGGDEPARLARAYNELLAGIKNAGAQFSSTTELLSDLVARIKASAEQVNGASREIAEGNTNLSQRTEEQASGLEETASSMEEFTATVKQNSESAQEANTLGAAAAGKALQGGEAMNEVVTTMSNINASSQKIVEIISVIDGIAFQTNILALNAAVEAARAGEQGRGFAVVAGEVRSLAQRSSAAAKEIKELIGDTVAKVTDGTGQVERAGSTMQELVGSVQRVTNIVSDIAAASREQSSGIDQVNKAIAQMDEVTQQNSALVEEAAAAAGALEEQAKALLELVGSFKVDNAQRPVTHVVTAVHSNGRSKGLVSV